MYNPLNCILCNYLHALRHMYETAMKFKNEKTGLGFDFFLNLICGLNELVQASFL